MTRKRYHKLLKATARYFHEDKSGHPDFNITYCLRNLHQSKITNPTYNISYQTMWTTIYTVSDLGKYGLPTK